MCSQFTFEEQHQQPPPKSAGKQTRCFCVLCNKSESSNEWHVLSIRRSSHGARIAAMLGVKSLAWSQEPCPSAPGVSSVSSAAAAGLFASRAWCLVPSTHQCHHAAVQDPCLPQRVPGVTSRRARRAPAKYQGGYRFEDNVTSSSSSSDDGSEDNAESSHDNSNKSSEQEGDDNGPSGSSNGGSDMEVEGDDDAPEPSPPSPNSSRGAGRGRGQGRGNGNGRGAGRGRGGGAKQSGGKRAQPEGASRSSRDPKRSKT